MYLRALSAGFSLLALLCSTACSSAGDTVPESSAGGGGTGAGAGAGGTGAGTPCDVIEGTAAVTFTRDEGKTLTPSNETLRGTKYTFGLAVAKDVEGKLLASHDNAFLVSTDSGCRWSPLGEPVGATFDVRAAPGGRFYAFEDNGARIVRIDGEAITELAVPFETPPLFVMGLAVDARDADHLRIGDSNGTIWDSVDAGASWQPAGVSLELQSKASRAYRVEFDPNDLNHMIVGAAVLGGFQSDDGAATWTPMTGLSRNGNNANVFEAVISPIDGEVVWLEGIDLSISNPDAGRHIYRSTDGGKSFTAVVTGKDFTAGAPETSDVILVNQSVLAPHPTNAAVLYFVFGTCFGSYGTDLYRYDESTGRVTKTHNDHCDIDAIAFSRDDPTLMYLGLEVEPVL